MENYKFKDFENDLNNGFQLYLTFVNNRYLIYKTSANCYTQELIDYDEKNPQPSKKMLTRKRVKEIFPNKEDIEYKIGIYEEDNLKKE